jgi:hypothetical protein
MEKTGCGLIDEKRPSYMMADVGWRGVRNRGCENKTSKQLNSEFISSRSIHHPPPPKPDSVNSRIWLFYFVARVADFLRTPVGTVRKKPRRAMRAGPYQLKNKKARLLIAQTQITYCVNRQAYVVWLPQQGPNDGGQDWRVAPHRLLLRDCVVRAGPHEIRFTSYAPRVSNFLLLWGWECRK